ncbi:hypothetical protein BD626DRAFT_629338 [Schizophyllum amplum]|uniref:Uncharacterized protein n=1 Tax=Schizophyllum amplum TaxID=97359 RepID=A0A550CHW7_9AGAR|nr:hypothetical protein BD626DRAFT_629338 [Auriculariopsis ampla]
MWLWLHLPDMCRSRSQQIPGTDDIIQDLLWYQITNDAIIYALSLPGTNPRNPKTFDMVAARETFASVNHHPSRLVAYTIRNVIYLLASLRKASGNATIEDENDVSQSVMFAITNLDQITTNIDIDGVRKRDVTALVDLMRELHTTPGHRSTAFDACSLLCSLCQNTSTEHRPIVWALKRGLFPLLISLSRTVFNERERSVLCDMFMHIAIWTSHLPVAAAFCNYREEATFSAAGLEDVDKWTLIDEEVLRRCEMVRQMYDLKCQYPSCVLSQDLAERRMALRRCQCYEVYPAMKRANEATGAYTNRLAPLLRGEQTPVAHRGS